ncbi:hypothetical protein [Arthrobacter sp. ES3-54]|uniref:hypothetical protein n=1 Tax=Arthrobacter sp. ES3-54 TaxID=1502991 RepID=UPI00240773BB|nr:hypothetical protein [Arthrobacter sp. ES3-54]MDF9753009.1 hypothetical protein [Arthrobacter sp. ES3-54]
MDDAAMTNAMKKKESSAAAVDAFEGVAADLSGAGVALGQTFGSRALMVNSKAMACLNGEAMAFKLGRDSPHHSRALELPGAQLFDPSGMGRPFKDWVEVPTTSADAWPSLAEAALAFTSS